MLSVCLTFLPNSVSMKKNKFSDQHFRVSVPLFHSKDGGTTIDASSAKTDLFGSLSSAGYSKDFSIPHPVYSPPLPLSFNPRNPQARELAFEMRSAFDGLVSSPNIYGDEFSILQHANNIASQVFHRLTRINDSSPSDVSSEPSSKN